MSPGQPIFGLAEINKKQNTNINTHMQTEQG